MNGDIFYALDFELVDFFPVVYDDVNFIFYDPVSEREYDHPWVFSNLEEASTLGIDLLREQIKKEELQLREDRAALLTKTRRYYHMCNIATWFYYEPVTVDVRLCIRDKTLFRDANTYMLVGQSVIRYNTYEECFNYMVEVIKVAEAEKEETLTKLQTMIDSKSKPN